MYKFVYILFIILFLSIKVKGQSTNFYGLPAINEIGTCVTADVNGNSFTGIISNGIGQLIRKDQSGQIIWTKSIQLNAANTTQYISSIQLISDTVYGCGLIRNGNQTLGGFYFKLNATTGSAYWIKYNNTSTIYYSSIQYHLNKFILVGSGLNTSSNLDLKVLSVSSQTGNVVWESTLNGVLFNGFGVNYLDDIMTSTEMVNNKLFFIGRSYVDGANSLDMRATLFGVDNTGSIFLKKYLDFNTSNNLINRFYGMTISYDGIDSLIIGQFGDDNCNACNDFKMSLIKTDLNGNVGWSKMYDIVGANTEILHELNVTPTGYLIMGKANFGSESIVFVKTDKNGNVIDGKKMELAGYSSIIINNNFYIGGSSAFANGTHRFVASVNNGNANLNDVVSINLNENVNDIYSCIQFSPISVNQTIITPYSENLSFSSSPQTLNHSNGQQTITVNPIISCSIPAYTIQHFSNCSNDSIVLNGLPSTYQVQWSNGETGNNVITNSIDTLFATIVNPNTCCFITDTIVPQLSGQIIGVELPVDTLVCLNSNEVYELIPTVNNISSTDFYEWNTGVSGVGVPTNLEVSNSGQYILTVSNACFSQADTINIIINHFPEIIIDSLFQVCEVDLPFVISPILNYEDSFLWSDNSTDSSFNFLQEGSISLSAINTCGVTTETIELQVEELPLIFLPDAIDTCLNYNTNLEVIAVVLNGQQIVWSNGMNGSNLFTNSSGQFTISVTNNCGFAMDSIDININNYPWIDIPNQLDTCFDTTGFIFEIDHFYGDLVLNDTVFGNSIFIQESGYLSYAISTSCGSIQDSILIQNISTQGPLLTEDTLIVCDVYYNLNELTPNWLGSGSWFDPFSNPWDNQIEQSGWHYLLVENDCSSNMDSIYIDFIGNVNLFFPNSFIPNADGLNDVYDEKGVNYSIVEIVIFNRWGEIVYSEKGGFSGWNGMFKNQKCPDGIYVVKCTYTDCTGIETEMKLHVNLLR